MLQSFKQLATVPGSALVARPSNARDVVLWLKGAQTKLEDARQTAISDGTRLDAAWDSVLFCCLAIACAEGYGASSEKGHHVVVLEGAIQRLGLSAARFDELDALRDWRNRKYRPGQQVQARDVQDAIDLVSPFLDEVGAWFGAQHSTLMRQGMTLRP